MSIWGPPTKPRIPKGTVPKSFTMTAQELREREVLAWSERVFQGHVVELARSLGFSLVYHTYDSRRSQPGFPDLVLVNPGRGRLLFRELKSAKERISGEQKRWGDGFRAVGADFDFWRPQDWVSGRIECELKGGGFGA